MKRAEKDFLKSMEGSSQENQPPKKKRCLIKVKKSSGKAGQKMKDEAGQKGQKSQTKGENKMNDTVLDFGSPPKQPKTQTVPLDPGILLKLRYISGSRQNFATNVMRKLFTRAERAISNVNGVLGKSQLDVDKVEYIKSVTFKIYPVEQNESLESAWSKYRGAIDEANRHLYRPKYIGSHILYHYHDYTL